VCYVRAEDTERELQRKKKEKGLERTWKKHEIPITKKKKGAQENKRGSYRGPGGKRDGLSGGGGGPTDCRGGKTIGSPENKTGGPREDQ